MPSMSRAAARRVLPDRPSRARVPAPLLLAVITGSLALAGCLPKAKAEEPESAPVAATAPQDTGRTATPRPPEKKPAAEPKPTPPPAPAPRPAAPKPEPKPAPKPAPVEPKPAEPKPAAPAAARVGPPPPALPAAERERLAREAVLPRRRIVAYYGTPLSRGMGILGELPPKEMLARLKATVAEWQKADPSTPVVPALQVIVSAAAGTPGPEGKYRTRAPARVIQEVIDWADSIHGLVFLDIQPGHSTVQEELPRLIPYLLRPNVHLALDPEWNMPPGVKPAEKIGTMDASTINYAVDLLAKLVQARDLPPKILVVHRFTHHMVTNVEDVQDNDPRVQVVLDMDGWGPPTLKRSSYRDYVARAPIDLKGFKLFYKNDRKGDSRMMTPAEVLALKPAPIYIQYQ